MKPKITSASPVQLDLERQGALLAKIINPRHPLVQLADKLDWQRFEELFAATFHPDNGRPGLPTRLLVGLHYLKYAYDLSDEDVLAGWLENPYWQHFCGGVYFEHQLPLDASSLTRWRERIQAAGAEELLRETLRCALELKLARPASLKRINVDTTVQAKHIRYPTDARLYDRARERLVTAARKEGLALRQSYTRVGKKTLRRQSGYARAQQFVRARRETRKLKTLLGRVVRDIQRKAPAPPAKLAALLHLAERLLRQQREDHHKLYSIHEPQVECLAKGKPHRPYEFGCKASVSTTARENWVVGALALNGNPYDGHTLRRALAQVQRLTGRLPEQATCDLGYRGHKYDGPCHVEIVNRYRKAVAGSMRVWHRRRSAIEPVIGHMKADCRMERNRLKGVLGDQLNVLFAGCGMNFRKILRKLRLLFLRWLWAAVFSRLAGWLRSGALLPQPAAA
jgi:transposase, IS5 family